MKPPSRRLSLLAAVAAACALAAPALGDHGGNGNGRAKGNPHPQAPSAQPGEKGSGQTPTIVVRAGSMSVQGVVQAVWSSGAAVRLLDGRTVNLSLGHGTLVLVDGRPATLAAVRPGYVLVAIMKSGPSTVLRFVKPG